MSVLSLDADENPALSAASSGPAQTIILISKEGHRLPVARQALMASELCKTTLEGDRDATEIPLYHIEGAIVSKVIDYLTYHMKVPARKIEKPLQSSSMLDLVDKWDANFIENGEGPSANASSSAAAAAAAAAAASAAAAAAAAVPASPGSGQTAVSASSLAAAAASAPSAAAQEVLFKLLLAANYLNIRSLLQLACARVATLLRGRTPEQIRAVFNIRQDFTQAEEEEIRKEYRDLIG